MITLNTSIELLPPIADAERHNENAALDEQPMNIGEETQNDEDPSHNSVHNQGVERKEAEKINKSRLDEDYNLSVMHTYLPNQFIPTSSFQACQISVHFDFEHNTMWLLESLPILNV